MSALVPLFLWVFIWITPDGKAHLWAYWTKETCEASRAKTLPTNINPYGIHECVRVPLYDIAGTPEL